MSIQYTDDSNQIDFCKVTNLLNTFGGEETNEVHQVMRAFLDSAYAVYAIDRDEVVGVCRALSDDLEWTLVSDLAVSDQTDREEVTGTLLRMFIERFKGQEIFTYADSAYYDLLEAQGFFRSKNSFTVSGEVGNLEVRAGKEANFLPLGYRFEHEYEKVPKGFPSHAVSEQKEDIQLRYTDSRDGIDYEEVAELLANAFQHSKKDSGIIRTVFEGSRFVQFAFDRDRLIGCARAESDGVRQGLILNVAVDPAYQGHHLGMEIISRLSAQMQGENIFLNTHPGGVGFYNRTGFRRNKNAFLYPAHPDMPPEVKRGFYLPKGYRYIDEY
ncbi:MAG: GNAT family N-acetyltransferase [Lachnospiraceae bacterium]|nr:GNAT family N-acetyltransferase [Lachnospiraceae bacterium]